MNYLYQARWLHRFHPQTKTFDHGTSIEEALTWIEQWVTFDCVNNNVWLLRQPINSWEKVTQVATPNLSTTYGGTNEG